MSESHWLNTKENIRDLGITPVLLMHGAQDQVIPVAQAEDIYKAAEQFSKQPQSRRVQLKVFDRLQHNNVLTAGRREVLAVIDDWMEGNPSLSCKLGSERIRQIRALREQPCKFEAESICLRGKPASGRASNVQGSY